MTARVLGETNKILVNLQCAGSTTVVLYEMGEIVNWVKESQGGISPLSAVL